MFIEASPVICWINRLRTRTPIQYLSNKHLINNLRFLKRKGLKICKENHQNEIFWDRYMPGIFYDLVIEAEKRGINIDESLTGVEYLEQIITN